MKISREIVSLLIFIILIRLVWIFVENKKLYFEVYDVGFWLKEYESSQWKLGEKAKRFLSDAQTHAIVGYQYLKGADPSKVNPEHPPLGRNLIGLSIIFFKNEKIISFFLGIIVLVLLFFLARLYLTLISSLLTVVLFSFEPLFGKQMSTSMLDLPFLLFLLAFLICFIKGEREKNFFLSALSSLFLGLAMGTKIYLSSLIFLGFILLWLFLRGNFQRFMLYYFSLVFLPLGYLLSYWQYFIHYPSIISFAKFQRWLTSWWAGTPFVQKGIVWPMLLFGKWYTWWGKEEIIKVDSYTLLWPILGFFAVAGSILAFKKRDFDILFVFLFTFGYLIFLNFEPVFPRHLLVIFPGFYILALYVFDSFLKRMVRQ